MATANQAVWFLFAPLRGSLGKPSGPSLPNVRLSGQLSVWGATDALGAQKIKIDLPRTADSACLVCVGMTGCLVVGCCRTMSAVQSPFAWSWMRLKLMRNNRLSNRFEAAAGAGGWGAWLFRRRSMVWLGITYYPLLW